jgi:hypothetical protein
MAKHKNFNLTEAEKIDPSIRQFAYTHGIDMVDWPEGFEVIYSALVFADHDKQCEETDYLKDQPRYDKVFDLISDKILKRPDASQIGEIVRERLLARDVEFFSMLLNLVERKTPVEPLRSDLFKYKCEIAFKKKAPPINFDDVRMALSTEVRQSVQDEATIRKAAKAVGVWPPEKAREIRPSNIGK